MDRSKLIWPLVVAVAATAAAIGSYLYATHRQQAIENQNLAHTQAMLAVGHHKTYERLEALLERKCFEAALVEARGLKNLQVVLVSENLRATNNDPELLAYIQTRDPKLYGVISSGRLPELKTYSTTCP